MRNGKSRVLRNLRKPFLEQKGAEVRDCVETASQTFQCGKFMGNVAKLGMGFVPRLQQAVFERVEGLGTRGKLPEPFVQGGKTFPKRA